MKNSFALRAVAVGLLLAFAWRGEIRQLEWPPASKPEVAVIEQPDAESLGWSAAVNVDGMTPKDRAYCADFYAALGRILANDSGAKKPAIIDSTPKFQAFHAGSLQLAIDLGEVGRYPGLGASIDRAFFAAAGDDEEKSMPAEVKARFIRCCKALAWRFTIHGES